MTMDDTFDIPADVVARRVGDEVVILDLGRGTYFGLDPVGARIWELIGNGLPLSQVCETMAVEFDVGLETLECDILSLVNALQDEKLLAVHSE